MYENQLEKILTQVNADTDLNASNVIKKIKEKLKEKALDTYQEWQNNQFNINHIFTIRDDFAILNPNGGEFEITSRNISLLCMAVRIRKIDLIKTLIAAGADVNLPTYNGMSPLHLAALSRNLEIVQALIAAGADVNLPDISSGIGPLYLAVFTDNLEVVQALIAAGARIREDERQHFLPLLSQVIGNGNLEIVQALIAAGVRIRENERQHFLPLLFGAAENGYLEVLQVLIAAGIRIRENEHQHFLPLLFDAAENGYLEVVRILIAAEINVSLQDDYGLTSLHFAVHNKHQEVAKALIAHEIKLVGPGAQKPGCIKPLSDSNYISDLSRSMSKYWDKCLGEVKKLEEENGLLYAFLKASDSNTSVSIWEKSESIRSKFDDQESIQEQYPEYAPILIDKANAVKEEIFLHNHKPLIDALSTYYKRGIRTIGDMKKFLDSHGNDFRKELGNGGVTLRNFIDFEDVKEKHVPKLKVQTFIEVNKLTCLESRAIQPS